MRFDVVTDRRLDTASEEPERYRPKADKGSGNERYQNKKCKIHQFSVLSSTVRTPPQLSPGCGGIT